MKRILLSALMALALSVSSVFAENVFYQSAMHLVGSVPNTMDIESNTADRLVLTTPDKGYSIIVLSFSLKETNRKVLYDGMHQMAREATVDLSNCAYLNLDTKTLHGLIAAKKDGQNILYAYAVCDDGEHAYILQVAAREQYHHLLNRFFETVEYYQ